MAFSRNMSDAQRIAVYRQMTQENCDWFNDLKRLKLPIWKDATGGIHSLAAIKRLRIYKHGHRIPVIFSHELGQRDNADTIMQRGQAFVFDSDWIKTLEGSYSLPVRGKKDRITGALAVLRLNEPHGPLDWKDAKAIEENLETSKDIVPRSQLKAGQKRVLDLVEKIYHTCTSSLWSNTNPLNPLHGKLKIVGGRSKEDAGWTDGATYIAINVERYDKVVMQDLHKLVFLTLHELVHCALREESVTAHGHSIEFYKLYHDLTQDDYNVMHHCQYLMRKLEYESRKKVRDRRGLQMEPPPEPPAAGVLVEEAASV
jgi:hypothetical protein